MQYVDPDEPLHDLGVLFVHGIGQSGQAETLLHFGEPLRKCLEEIAVTPNGGSVKVSIEHARLDPEPDEGPARAELRLTSEQMHEQRWLLAEAWWAKKFPTPTVAEIVSWGFKVLPGTLVAHFDRRLRRMGFKAFNALDGAHPIRVGVPRLLDWLLEGFGVVVALALLPFLLVILGALSLLGSVPYAPVREAARTVQRKLAATVGDSFVLKDKPIVAAAITSSVRENLEWLSARCKRVAVVAHSQGAAIAHTVLRSRVTAPCNLLVTFGSGLGKLSEIEQVGKERGRTALSMATIGALFAASFLFLNFYGYGGSIRQMLSWFGQALLIAELGVIFAIADLLNANFSEPGKAGADSPPSWMFGVLFVFAASMLAALFERGLFHVAIAAGFAAGLATAYLCIRRWQATTGRSMNARAQWLRDRDTYRERFQFRNRPWMRWLDVYSSADPVPNGPLLDDFEPKDMASVEITNGKSIVGDHTTYWKNEDEFLPRLAGELLGVVRLGAMTGAAQDVAARRRWRVGWRVAARRIVGLTAVALAWQWIRKPPAFLGSLAQVSPHTKFPISLLMGHPARLVLALVAVLWVTSGVIVLFGWRGWEKHEVSGLRSGDYRLASGRFLLFAAVLAALFIGGAWILAGSRCLIAPAAFALYAGGLMMFKRSRDWVKLRSASGRFADRRGLRVAEFRRAAEVAFKRRKTGELTSLGGALWGLDDDLALRALTEAVKLRSANAAWRLGWHFDALERRSKDPGEKACLRQEAKSAFLEGAVIGDANCAWGLGWKRDEDGDLEGATWAYERAIELGDAKSCSSLGWLLERQKQPPERIQAAYEEGVRRGDALSAKFLARRLVDSVRELRNADAVGATALRERALDLLRRAFDWGDVGAALVAGQLHLEAAEIEQARNAYSDGAHLHDAECAYVLGQLEEEERQDTVAARSAYTLSIRLDEEGRSAVKARYRLGRMLEMEGRKRAAVHQYRAAIHVPGFNVGYPHAAVALARLLEEQGKREEAKVTFQRGMDLDSTVSALPYVEFLERNWDLTEAANVYARGVSSFPPEALLKLGRFLHFNKPEAAKELLQLAVERRSMQAAVELYKILMGDRAAKTSLLDTIVGFGKWSALEAIRLFEGDHQSWPAGELKRRLEQAGEIPETNAAAGP